MLAGLTSASILSDSWGRDWFVASADWYGGAEREPQGRGTTMTTLLMFLFLVAVIVGGAVLGWLAHARKYGLHDDIDLIDHGEVAASSGDY